jgi:hypothetical protein
MQIAQQAMLCNIMGEQGLMQGYIVIASVCSIGSVRYEINSEVWADVLEARNARFSIRGMPSSLDMLVRQRWFCVTLCFHGYQRVIADCSNSKGLMKIRAFRFVIELNQPDDIRSFSESLDRLVTGERCCRCQVAYSQRFCASPISQSAHAFQSYISRHGC